MRSCCICHKTVLAGNGPFFNIPNDEGRKCIWAVACQMTFKSNDRICGDHFLPSDVIKGAKRDKLMPNAVPFIISNPGHCEYPEMVNATPAKLSELDQVPLSENSKIEFDSDITASFGNSSFLDNMQEDVIEYREMHNVSEARTLYRDMLNEISEQKKIIKKLQTEIKDLKIQLAEKNKVVSCMGNIFTQGQIRKIISPGAIQRKWDDISSAICLHATGPRAYKHLYNKGFPLPSISTLQRWSRKVNINEGILTPAIDVMRHNADLSDEEKICVLAFDEMKVVDTYEYESVGDFVRKPANFVQVVIARGLRKSWKQPIFFKYDCEMDRPVLFSIILELHHAGYPVVAIVCDMGPSNRKLWTTLGASKDRPWFPNPVNTDDKIFTFADTPHLIKLIRNHFLDTGLTVKNELLKKETIQELMKNTSVSDVSITYKLTNEHITVIGPGRQKLKLATQLFSHATAEAIKRCHSLGFELYKPLETAEFIELVNNWFDVMNSNMNTFNYPGKEAFGINLENQKDILFQVNKLASTPMIPKKKSLEFFQKGILMTNNALLMLYEYVKQKYGMEYILTYRLNQDVLEHLFGALRSKGGLNDHPTPKEFKFRMRKYILARNTEILEGTGNVECDTTDWIGSKNDPTDSLNCCSEEPNVEDEPIDVNELETSTFHDSGVLQHDALEYIAGYIIRKQNLEQYQSHENSFTWVDQISKGSLNKPSPEFLKIIHKLELVFESLNGTEMDHNKNVQKRLFESSLKINVAEKIKKKFLSVGCTFVLKALIGALKSKRPNNE